MNEARHYVETVQSDDKAYQAGLQEGEFLKLVKEFEDAIRARLDTLEPGTKALIEKLLQEASEQDAAAGRERASA